jgi:thymidylate synthase ThyX
MQLESLGYKAKILLDSVSPNGVRLTTMEVTFPRFVLAEFNTHRMFSRNSASSRAIPVEKQLKRITENPCVPIYWGKNQKGMQASEEVSEKWKAEYIWLRARDKALEYAKHLADLGVHKQVTNRLLEPFMWHTVIVTATNWSNFFALRCHPDTQPELRKAAMMMQEIHESHVPRQFDWDEWHLPLFYRSDGQLVCSEDLAEIEKLSRDFEMSQTEIAKRVSAGRCARVSYLTHDGQRNLAADLQLCNMLIDSGHMSPLEHVATPDPEGSGNFAGWRQFRAEIQYEDDFSKKLKEQDDQAR